MKSSAFFCTEASNVPEGGFSVWPRNKDDSGVGVKYPASFGLSSEYVVAREKELREKELH